MLEAADNKIASWPEDLGGLVELHTLNLGNNGLKSLAGTELVSRKRMWMPERRTLSLRLSLSLSLSLTLSLTLTLNPNPNPKP